MRFLLFTVLFTLFSKKKRNLHTVLKRVLYKAVSNRIETGNLFSTYIQGLGPRIKPRLLVRAQQSKVGTLAVAISAYLRKSGGLGYGFPTLLGEWSLASATKPDSVGPIESMTEAALNWPVTRVTVI
jgi:hypothetical protein